MKTIHLIVFCFCSFFTVLGQKATELENVGFNFSKIYLEHKSDISKTEAPIVGQIIFNTNVNLEGEGQGYFIWQNTYWKKINTTTPSNSIVLSNVEINPILLSFGFVQIGQINIDNSTTPYFLYKKK